MRPVTSCRAACCWCRDRAQDSLIERTVSVGDVWHNAPGMIHTIEALEDADVLEASTPHLDDVVRISGPVRSRGYKRDLTGSGLGKGLLIRPATEQQQREDGQSDRTDHRKRRDGQRPMAVGVWSQ